jgi:hypothetical protein
LSSTSNDRCICRSYRTPRIKYLGVNTIRQDPALALELKVVIAVELGEAPEKSG